MPLTEIAQSDGFKPGDLVTIRGERETRYVIKKIILNPRTGHMWADLFGGRVGRGPQLRGKSSSHRSISLDRLIRK